MNPKPRIVTHPNACLERMIDAEIDGDAAKYGRAFSDLRQWLEGGGYPPYWDMWDLDGLPEVAKDVDYLKQRFGGGE